MIRPSKIAAKVEPDIGRARSVSTEVKAAYLCGLYAGAHWDDSEATKAFIAELRPHAETAAHIAFGDGAFNPLAIWEMEAFYERVVCNCEAGK